MRMRRARDQTRAANLDSTQVPQRYCNLITQTSFGLTYLNPSHRAGMYICVPSPSWQCKFQPRNFEPCFRFPEGRRSVTTRMIIAGCD